MKIQVQTAPFHVGDETAALADGRPEIGAIASFIGLVRDANLGDPVKRLTLEHYPGMTENVLSGIADTAMQRWSLIDVSVIHRVGALQPTDPIVLVLTAAAHRADAFAACQFIMDKLKTTAPFWKKEATGTTERWLDDRDSDHQAAAGWDNNRETTPDAIK